MGKSGQNQRHFYWNKRKIQAALDLAEGTTQLEAAARAGISRQCLTKWLKIPAFREEIDRLTIMMGIAYKAERIREAKRVVREKMDSDNYGNRDLLDWLKYVKCEMEGVHLNMTGLLGTYIIKTEEENRTESKI